MIWWDWNTSQRLALLGTMFVVAMTATIVLGGKAYGWGAFLGGTAFLFIPQMLAWALCIGLTTGRMPSAYGRSELRTKSPTWFWITTALYAGLLLFILGIIAGFVILGV